MDSETSKLIIFGLAGTISAIGTGVIRYLLAENKRLKDQLAEYEEPAREATRELLRRGWRDQDRQRELDGTSWPSIYQGRGGRQANPRRKP